MQIVIDITPEAMEDIKNDRASRCFMQNKILNGKPLPKGRWKSTTLGGYTCSNCNKEFTYSRFIGRALYYYYCPNCGAKMEVEDEDSNN